MTEKPKRPAKPKTEAAGRALNRLASEIYSRRQQMADARQAVGLSPAQRLQWLGDFARRDQVETVQAADELACFIGYSPEEQRISPAQVPPILSALRDVMDNLGVVPGAVVPLPIPIVDGLAWRPGSRIALRDTGNALLPSALAAMASVLLMVDDQLQRCGACGRLFSKVRPRQRFCNNNCRVAKWREQHHARHIDNRHGQYAKKKTAQLPGARVQRRSRKAQG